jgi:hypothetical protein
MIRIKKTLFYLPGLLETYRIELSNYYTMYAVLFLLERTKSVADLHHGYADPDQVSRK